MKHCKFHIEYLLSLVNEQAEDEGLWFVAATAAEAYLQQELRRLHAAVEKFSDNAKANTETEVSGFGEAVSSTALRSKVWLAANEIENCDNCKWQEGCHFCLIHHRQFKNMNLLTCESFEERQ